MPSGTHDIQLDLPITTIWDFVSSIDNWAPLVPGYIAHEIISDKESTWTFKGDLGPVSKTIELKVDVTKWQEPDRVEFNLTGLNDKFEGTGYFAAEEVEAGQMTKITGFLDITAAGATAPVVNAVLKKFVPDTARELTVNVANKIVELEKVEL